MAEIDLRQFATIAELRQLAEAVEQEIQRRWEEERARFRVQAQEVAAQYGMQPDALFHAPKKAAKKPKGKAVAPPKYQNPANPAEVWNGAGKMPEWFTKALRAGTSRQAMEIRNQAFPAVRPEEDAAG